MRLLSVLTAIIPDKYVLMKLCKIFFLEGGPQLWTIGWKINPQRFWKTWHSEWSTTVVNMSHKINLINSLIAPWWPIWHWDKSTVGHYAQMISLWVFMRILHATMWVVLAKQNKSFHIAFEILWKKYFWCLSLFVNPVRKNYQWDIIYIISRKTKSFSYQAWN